MYVMSQSETGEWLVYTRNDSKLVATFVNKHDAEYCLRALNNRPRKITRIPGVMPARTLDGRPYVAIKQHKDNPCELWEPQPLADGDAIYCDGQHIGTIHQCEDGNYLDTLPMDQLPEGYRKHLEWFRSLPVEVK
jgi:hypothetical protein